MFCKRSVSSVMLIVICYPRGCVAPATSQDARVAVCTHRFERRRVLLRPLRSPVTANIAAKVQYCNLRSSPST
jgi:hypothetical protein